MDAFQKLQASQGAPDRVSELRAPMPSAVLEAVNARRGAAANGFDGDGESRIGAEFYDTNGAEVPDQKFDSSGAASYSGDRLAGKPHGNGRMVYSNGGSYEGQFINGMPHGYGMRRYEENSVYQGEWEFGERAGYGVLTYSDGSVYDGQWARDLKHGLGKYVTADQLGIFEGEWQFGMMHGTGKMSFGAVGATYDGKFEQGRKHGHGTFTYPTGETWTGNWDKDKAIGVGAFFNGRETIRMPWFPPGKSVSVDDILPPSDSDALVTMPEASERRVVAAKGQAASDAALSAALSAGKAQQLAVEHSERALAMVAQQT